MRSSSPLAPAQACHGGLLPHMRVIRAKQTTAVSYSSEVNRRRIEFLQRRRREAKQASKCHHQLQYTAVKRCAQPLVRKNSLAKSLCLPQFQKKHLVAFPTRNNFESCILSQLHVIRNIAPFLWPRHPVSRIDLLVR